MSKSAFNYDRFYTDFCRLCLEEISTLAERHPDLHFYGVGVYLDAFNGNFGLYANSEEHFASTLKMYQERHPDDYRDPDKIQDLKISIGDWQHESIECAPDDRLDRQYHTIDCSPDDPLLREQSGRSAELLSEAYTQSALLSDADSIRLLEVACRVADAIKESPALSQLPKSDNFRLLVLSGNEPEADAVSRYEYWCKHGTNADFDKERHGGVSADTFEEFKQKIIQLFLPKKN